MRTLSRDLEDAKVAVMNAVYQGSCILEEFENAGLAGGNMHHVRQRLAGEAAKALEERWLYEERDRPPIDSEDV